MSWMGSILWCVLKWKWIYCLVIPQASFHHCLRICCRQYTTLGRWFMTGLVIFSYDSMPSILLYLRWGKIGVKCLYVGNWWTLACSMNCGCVLLSNQVLLSYYVEHPVLARVSVHLDSCGILLANNSNRGNSIPALEASLGDKRC